VRSGRRFLKVLRWFEDDILGRGRLPLVCCLIAFILTFFVTRTFVRYIRHRADRGVPQKWWEPRNIHLGKMHIHHVVVGVLLVMISGVTLVALSVTGNELEYTASAIVFGIGAALVLDEYALILHLSDVYWEEDGRTSVDAVFAAMAVGGLLVLGLHPFLFFISLWHDTTHSVPLRAGVVFAMDAGSFDATSTDLFLILILAATFLGGPGQAYGAMLGAVVIGLATEISAAYITPSYKYVVAFVALLLVLGLRPTGLLGMRVPEK